MARARTRVGLGGALLTMLLAPGVGLAERGHGPPEGRGAPPEGRGAPPEGRGAPPEGRGAPPEGRGAPPEGRGGSGGELSCEQESARLEELESQARSLATAEGCTDVSQCKTAAVGAMACGGPRDYLVYCSATTEEDALQKLLAQLQQQEEQYNQRCGVMSICVFISEPQVTLVDGMCQEVQTGAAELE